MGWPGGLKRWHGFNRLLGARAMLKAWLARGKSKLAGSPAAPKPAAPALEAPPADSRSRAKALLMGLQDSICAGLEQLDGGASFERSEEHTSELQSH